MKVKMTKVIQVRWNQWKDHRGMGPVYPSASATQDIDFTHLVGKETELQITWEEEVGGQSTEEA